MTDASTPEGWPCGYTPVTWTEGRSGLERHSWQRDNVVAREGWDTIEACLESAHAHYRTTREWRLEQERDKLLRGWELSRETTRSLERQLAEVTRERDAAQRAERELQQRIASMVPR